MIWQTYSEHMERGGSYFSSRDMAKAEREFNLAAKAIPEEGEAYLRLGECAEARGDEGGALEYFRQAAERGWWTVKTLHQLGDSCIKQSSELMSKGRVAERQELLREAIQWLDRVVAEPKMEEYVKRERIHLFLGLCHRWLGEHETAIREFRRAIDEWDENHWAWYWEIHSRIDVGDLNGARMTRALMRIRLGNWVPVDHIFDQSADEFDDVYTTAFEKWLLEKEQPGLKIPISVRVPGSKAGVATKIFDGQQGAQLVTTGEPQEVSPEPTASLRPPWVADDGTLAKNERQRLIGIKRKLDRSGQLVGESPAFLRAIEQIDDLGLVSDGDKPVVLLGETGVGKSFLAKFIAKSGPRSGGPFHIINAQQLATQDFGIVQGELAGIGKGSGLPGVRNGKEGWFKMSEKGTLLIDEFTLLTPDAQGYFLTVLDGEEVQPLGNPKESYQPNVRFVFATNADPREVLEKGTLREDFWDRVEQYCVGIPPLRKRIEDIPLLARHFLGEGKLDPRVLLALLRCDWTKHNVRSLKIALENAYGGGKGKTPLEKLNLPIPSIGQISGLSKGEAEAGCVEILSPILRSRGIELGKGLNKELAMLIDVSPARMSALTKSPAN